MPTFEPGVGDVMVRLGPPLPESPESPDDEPQAASRPAPASVIAAAAALHPLLAGSIIGTGLGKTESVLSIGDTLRIEMNDRTGHSIFGAIEQTVKTRGN